MENKNNKVLFYIKWFEIEISNITFYVLGYDTDWTKHLHDVN